MDDSDPSIPCSTSASVSTESNKSPTIHLKNTQPASKSDLKQNTSAAVSNYKHGIALSISKILLLILTQFPLRAAGYPVLSLLSRSNVPDTSDFLAAHKQEPMDARTYWINMGISVTLVLLGGVFAGLTLGLMGQDEIYLQVIQQSGELSEKKAAAKVLSLLKRGKHWVLVTLLLANVITNESLPIVLDRVLGGGWPAVASSTVAIVIFGEIIPQSISVRYGLSVGAWFAPFVLALMYITYPVAYPVALLLDRILGEDHGTIYKRAGLKTLVGLHKTMGVERLNDDEVTIISAVLDLKDKPVASIMTPMDDVYTMSADRILDEPTIEEILHSGFNRIPIHAPDEPTNFIGMLLVRTLITYDPEDNFPISSFPLATLPETGPQTSCLNILNYFQEGKSHMVVVSNTPGASSGAVGVLTLEDVIEELIGEEIIDESDVYVDIHKAIRRTIPGPLSKATSLALFRHSPRTSLGYDEDGIRHRLNPLNKASNPKQTTNASITIKRSNLENFTSPLNPSTTHVPSLMDAHSPTDSHTPNPSHIQQKNGYVPSNLSKSIKNPTENDSSTDLDNDVHIHDQLLPVPDRNYGSIHRTEQGAVREALYQNSLSPRRSNSYLTENARNSRDNSASRHSSKSEANNNKSYSNGNNDSKNGYSHPHGYYDSNNGEEPANYQDRIVNVNDISPEFHSYRTGGIIESIINVDGVSKTIIEDVNKDTIPESYRSQANFGSQGYQENLPTEENGYGTTGGIQSSAASGRSRRSGGEGEHESLLPRH